MMAIKTARQIKNEHNNDNVDEETFMKLIKIIIRIYKTQNYLRYFHPTAVQILISTQSPHRDVDKS